MTCSAVGTAPSAIEHALGADIIALVRAQGPRYRTRMNVVLRAYIAAASSRPPKPE